MSIFDKMARDLVGDGGKNKEYPFNMYFASINGSCVAIFMSPFYNEAIDFAKRHRAVLEDRYVGVLYYDSE